MIWWERVGLGLEAWGLGVAIWGVFMTYSEALDRRLDVDLRRRVMRWVGRTLLRRRPKVVTGSGVGLTATSGMGAGGPPTTPQRPGETANVAERLAYLTSSVDSLWQETAAVEERARSLVAASETKATDRMDQMTGRQESTDERVLALQSAVVGRDGAGLQVAALGLALTLLGVLLTMVGTL